MADRQQHDTRTTRRPDCVTEIRMGNSVLVVSGYCKKDTTTTAAVKMARVLEAEAAATQEPHHTVQERVKLPPPGGFLRIAVREEKLIYRNCLLYTSRCV